MNLDHSQNLTVADPELQIRGGWGGPAHPDPEVRGVGGGGGLVSIWSVWSKHEGGRRGLLGRSRLPLNPPLLKNFLFPTVCCQKFFQSFVQSY